MVERRNLGFRRGGLIAVVAWVAAGSAFAQSSGASCEQRADLVTKLRLLIAKRLASAALIAILSLVIPSLSPNAAAQTLPSGAPIPVPGDSSDSSVRLQEWEYRLPFVGGCAAILDISYARAVTSVLARSRWVGACPFGVAHGPGYLAYDGTHEPLTFVYGVPIWNSLKKPHIGYSQSATAPWRFKKIVYPDLKLTPEQDRSHGNDKTQLFSKDEVNGSQLRLTSMAVNSLYCPGVLDLVKRPENRFGGYIFDNAARKQLEAYCKTHRGVFVLLQTVETYSWDFEDRRLDKVLPREENFLKPCLTETRLDCVRLMEPLIAPVRAELQALNQSKPAEEAALFDRMRERFRPLEAARSQRIAAWVKANQAKLEAERRTAAPAKKVK